MSQWNNSYGYNNQFQVPPNSWNGDLNGQYVNQPYYDNRQYESSNQYVSFDEFLTQMQGNGVPQNNASNYNNVQYQAYPTNQYNYQNVPSQNPQMEYNYGHQNPTTSNTLDTYSTNIQNQYNQSVPESNTFSNEVVMNSKLTPTATEFVPKCSINVASTSQSTSQETSVTHNDEPDNRSSTTKSSESNWRERPSNSETGNSQVEMNNFGRYQKNYKNTEGNRNRESNSRYEKRNNESKHESNGRHRNEHSNIYQSNQQNKESSIQNKDSENSANDNYSHQNENQRNFETGNRNETRRYANENNQSKANSKSKNKDSDAGRTFYNSSINKNSQDVRNGRGESSGRNRNWIGSQRVRTAERNNIEDEQYANTYMHYKDDRAERVANNNKHEKTASPVKGKNKPTNDSGGT